MWPHFDFRYGFGLSTHFHKPSQACATCVLAYARQSASCGKPLSWRLGTVYLFKGSKQSICALHKALKQPSAAKVPTGTKLSVKLLSLVWTWCTSLLLRNPGIAHACTWTPSSCGRSTTKEGPHKLTGRKTLTMTGKLGTTWTCAPSQDILCPTHPCPFAPTAPPPPALRRA